MAELAISEVLTPELHHKLDVALAEIVRTGPDCDPAAVLLKHGVGLVDRERIRCLIDERVYEGALFRSHHWQDLALKLAPVPMILFCPRCGARHVDKPDPAKDWTNPPHRTHFCHACEFNWRPADIATVGVAVIATRGRLDGDLPERAGQETPMPAFLKRTP